MKINILRDGDEVISVQPDFAAVKRKDGEVDIIPFYRDGMGLRIDIAHIVTIGYGNNTVEETTADGDVQVINF